VEAHGVASQIAEFAQFFVSKSFAKFSKVSIVPVERGLGV
jgi:hypothetical protein